MGINLDAIRTLLCERLCEEVRVERRPDGAVMVRTRFEFPDGDRFPIHLSEAASSGFRLSDRGHTLMRISYEHDVDSFMEGSRRMILKRIMRETGLSWDGDQGALCLDTAPERLPTAIFSFGQALTQVYDLAFLSRSNVASTFYGDLTDLLFSLIDEMKIKRDYIPDVPNANAYPVDYRIEAKGGVPLFLHGVPNRDKARLTAIMLSHFHRHRLRFESILVFQNQAEIPRTDLARLSDVGGDMISSLGSQEDLSRKVLQRVVA